MPTLTELIDLIQAQCGPGCSCGPCQLGIGDPISVDGFRGRAVIVARKGRRITFQFRSGQTEERDIRYVHKL